MANKNGNTRYVWEDVAGAVEIAGTRYYLMVATHTEELEPDSVSRPSLLQVYMRSECDNEDVEKFGETLDILVMSQAVQADGFNDEEDLPTEYATCADYALESAFGEITAANHPWAEEVFAVTNASEIKDAVDAGATAIVVKNDITLSEVLEVKGDLTIIADGNTIKAPANGTRVINVSENKEDVNLTIAGAVLEASDKERGISFYANEGNLNVNIIKSEINAEHYGLNVAGDNANVKINVKNSKLTGYAAFQTWSPKTVAVFDDCVLEGINKWSGTSDDFATIVVNKPAKNSKLVFNNCTIIATEKGSADQVHYIDNIESDWMTTATPQKTDVEWNNCTFITNGVEGAREEKLPTGIIVNP